MTRYFGSEFGLIRIESGRYWRASKKTTISFLTLSCPPLLLYLLSMKISLFLLVTALPLCSFAATDWSKAPIECVEDVVPQLPNETCLDLSQVAEPGKDFPANFSESDIAEWKRKRKTLTACRYLEIVRRENLNLGSQSPDALKVAWMLQNARDSRDPKIAAVYKASRDYKLPSTILAGAIRQESLFSDLGISPDGNNYSCGIGQFNILSWCNWITLQSAAFQQQTGWPQGLTCAQLNPSMVKQFYDIAVSKLGSVPIYKMNFEQFKDIKQSQVQTGLGSGTPQVIASRYQAVMSFTQFCINPLYAIQAKANEIAKIYKDYIPAGMKQSQLYKSPQTWPTQCREKGYEGAYPFHIGWLMAVGIYNAGPRVLSALSHYWGWNSTTLMNPATFANTTPLEVVEGLYWGGKYNKTSDSVTFNNLGGGTTQASWYKMCIVQRHIARVVQHSTRTGVDALVDSLEGSNPCGPDNPAPLARQDSSGVK